MAIFDVTLYHMNSQVFVLQVSSNPNRLHQKRKEKGATYIKQESCPTLQMQSKDQLRGPSQEICFSIAHRCQW